MRYVQKMDTTEGCDLRGFDSGGFSGCSLFVEAKGKPKKQTPILIGCSAILTTPSVRFQMGGCRP